jgi:hypothetical protein
MSKALNKKAWKRGEMEKLYSMGKAKSLITDIFNAVDNRDDKAITNKLWHMGFNVKNGRVI